MPRHGETRNIKILIDGVEYDTQLKSQGFDRCKYEGHADVLQVRYSEGSAIAKVLREIFCSTWNYVEQIKNLPENKEKMDEQINLNSFTLKMIKENYIVVSKPNSDDMLKS